MNTRIIRFLFGATIALIIAMLLFVLPMPARAAPTVPLTFTVNSPADVPDFNPGNGVCETALNNGVCTLRAAIQEANAHSGADTINLQSGVTYLLTQLDPTPYLSSTLVISDPVTILGAGPASTVIDGNGGSLGGRVFYITGTVVISGVTIQHGNSSNIAGGIFNNGRLTLINSAIVSNTANGLNDWGGGIFNSGPMTLINSTVMSNTTGGHNAFGGGIFNQGPMIITNSTISGNTTPGSGGGIYNTAYTVTFKSSTINGNTAANGGGIYKQFSPVIVLNSTISGNYSTVNGGGIYASAGTTSLFNVTMTRNRANSDDSGTGIGGGVYNATGSTFNFLNSIIALNENVIPTMPFPTLNYDDCAGTITSQGYSILYSYDSGYCTIVGPFTQTNPLLDLQLQNNGGSTRTHALLSGSPAIDAGNPGGCTDNLGALIATDQRGFLRPANGAGTFRCDIGAFELQRLLFLPLILR